MVRDMRQLETTISSVCFDQVCGQRKGPSGTVQVGGFADTLLYCHDCLHDYCAYVEHHYGETLAFYEKWPPEEHVLQTHAAAAHMHMEGKLIAQRTKPSAEMKANELIQD